MNDFLKDLEKELLDTVKDEVSSEEFDIECPECGKEITATQGINTCPYCNNEFNLNLDFDF